MLKNLVIAVLLAIVLTYSMGNIATELFDITINVGDHIMTPVGSLLTATAICAVLIVVGFWLAVSLLSVMLFVSFMIVAGLFVAGISVFWPMVLVVFILYLLVRDNKPLYN